MSHNPPLTSLSRTKSWLGITSAHDDALLNALIREAGSCITAYLGRTPFGLREYADQADGSGQASLTLRQWPVHKIASLTIDGRAAGEAEFFLEAADEAPPGRPQQIVLRQGSFGRGVSSIEVTYKAGYGVVDEAYTVPAATRKVTPEPAYGAFASDAGVRFGNGAALSLVAANPSAGQYALNGAEYQFAAADQNKQVLISYEYIPFDIEHACIAIVAERYRYRSRIGEVSKSIGGMETVSFSQRDMPDFVRLLLQPYRRVI